MFDEREAQYAQLKNDVEIAEALVRLESNPDFRLVFEEKFIEAFAISNVLSIASYDTEARVRAHEKMIARSHFAGFLVQVHQDGQMALRNIAELAAIEDAEDDEPIGE